VVVSSPGPVTWGRTAATSWNNEEECEATYLEDPLAPPPECESQPGGSAEPINCSEEYIVIEVFDEATGTWSVFWQGSVLVC